MVVEENSTICCEVIVTPTHDPQVGGRARVNNLPAQSCHAAQPPGFHLHFYKFSYSYSVWSWCIFFNEITMETGNQTLCLIATRRRKQGVVQCHNQKENQQYEQYLLYSTKGIVLFMCTVTVLNINMLND